MESIEERKNIISRCIEETKILVEENLEQCKADNKENCDELEDFLKELKKITRKKK